MADLGSRIERALVDDSSRPWFPHLTAELTGVGWEALDRATGLTPLSYGTVRVVCNDANASREIVTYVPDAYCAHDGGRMIAVELLPLRVARGHRQAPSTFYGAEEITGTAVLSCLKEAMGIVDSVPSLATTVIALVRSLHLMRPKHDDYDVSFSQPDLPFSVFVSVPTRRKPTDAMRVAEAIVHEAMHLQLTLLERVLPLVGPSSRRYFSPWRGEHRTAQGVLHALYVFRVIDCFLAELLRSKSCPIAWSDFADERREQIGRQVQELSAFQECEELTVHGAQLVSRLLS